MTLFTKCTCFAVSVLSCSIGSMSLAANPKAGSLVLYELQISSANACRTDTGSAEQRNKCLAKIAPSNEQIGGNSQVSRCKVLSELNAIKEGTIADLLEDSTDFEAGITLKYIKDSVGANTLWIMPPFPRNDQWSLPDDCDNRGSPYAVRDYFHIDARLSQTCIAKKSIAGDFTACYANADFKELIERAHKLGMNVWLDLAFNHFGHNYLPYDVQGRRSITDRIADGENLDDLWNFAKTFDESYLRPKLIEDATQLNPEFLGSRDVELLVELTSVCKRKGRVGASGSIIAPSVPLFNAYRLSLAHERARFNCELPYLEYAVPGFYAARTPERPSREVGDHFSNNWSDVKFLFLNDASQAHRHEYLRNREYLFSILNYWTSLGVDGFRLDHTTDDASGIGANFWRYLIHKNNFYASKRGQAAPVYMAEEFHDQSGLSGVVDVMTEGYVFEMNGLNGQTKDSAFVERVINGSDRFGGGTYVMSALETHDEKRLEHAGDHPSGFNHWTGAGFWGIGLTTWSTPMLLMGQEFGESWGLGFRRADFLRARFEGSGNHLGQNGYALSRYYRRLIQARLDPANRALLASGRHYLRRKDGLGRDPRIFAQMKWTENDSQGSNVMFTFHNLWEENVAQSYFIAPEVAARAAIQDALDYRLYDVISREQKGPCHSGADLKWDFYVSMKSYERAQWLRLERCN